MRTTTLRNARWFLVITCLFGPPNHVQAQEPRNACSLTSVARLPLNQNKSLFTTTVRINEHPVTMVVDTGAGHSAISTELAALLRLPQNRHKKITVHGVGGEMKASYPVIARAFQLGDRHLANYELTLVNMGGAKALVNMGRTKAQPDAPEGLLGIDLLSNYELEFDFPNKTLTLYAPANCSGTFVPWAGRFDAIQGRRQLDGQLFIPVSLNRVAGNLNREVINALVDTGSSLSSMGIDTAHDVGLSDEELRSDRPIIFIGANGVPVRGYQHHFVSFTFGETIFQRTRLSVVDDRYGVTQMLLGIDYLGWRKLWLSFGTEQIFLQSAATAQEQGPAP